MSNYIKITDYAAKDLLLTGNPAKIVKGSEIGADLDAVAVAVTTKVDTNGALGTPSSGTLTNCTGLPTAGLVNDAVTYAKIQNVSATDKVLGRSTAGAGDVEEIACTAAGRALIDDATAADQRTTLGAAARGANSDITSLTGITGPINEARGSVAMHATTMDLWAQPNIIDGTSSAVTITAIANAPQAGARRVLYPVAGSIITNGATFAVDGAADATAAAGDKWEFEAITTSTYKVHITKKDGTAVVSSGGGTKVQDFRLTLTTGIPVTTADVTGATTIYCTPYKGNQISLYDGAAWVTRSSAEFSLALGTLTGGKPYDVFCYDNAGTPTLEVLVWTNDTTRATALAYQDGVLVKSGDATRRYLGTFYTTAATTTEDSAIKRYLWNYYNRRVRKMLRRETTASWTYTTATWRQANAAAANQLDFIQGVAEDSVFAEVLGGASNSNATGVFASVGIGLDATNARAADQLSTGSTLDNSRERNLNAKYCGIPGAGRHYLAWLEYSAATGTASWYGTGGGLCDCGIFGQVMA